jgi:hypothetical protein
MMVMVVVVKEVTKTDKETGEEKFGGGEREREKGRLKG